MANPEETTVERKEYDRLKSESRLGYKAIIQVLEVLINKDFTHYGKNQVLKVVVSICEKAIADIEAPQSDYPF